MQTKMDLRPTLEDVLVHLQRTGGLEGPLAPRTAAEMHDFSYLELEPEVKTVQGSYAKLLPAAKAWLADFENRLADPDREEQRKFKLITAVANQLTAWGADVGRALAAFRAKHVHEAPSHLPRTPLEALVIRNVVALAEVGAPADVLEVAHIAAVDARADKSSRPVAYAIRLVLRGKVANDSRYGMDQLSAKARGVGVEGEGWNAAEVLRELDAALEDTPQGEAEAAERLASRMETAWKYAVRTALEGHDLTDAVHAGVLSPLFA